MIKGKYGVALSGIMFPLVTASGTYAKNYAAESISGVFIGYPGTGDYTSLSGRISGILGGTMYAIASLTALEMSCDNWAIKFSTTSGSLDQILVGQNDGYTPTDIITAVSGLKNNVSGLPGILAACSGPVVLRPGVHTNALVGLWGSTHTSSQIARVIDGGTAPSVDTSSIAAQVWNSLTATYTSSTTFAGNQIDTLTAISSSVAAVASGFAPILVAVSSITVATEVSGLTPILAAISGVTNAVASGFAPVLAAAQVATDTSAIAGQVWNTIKTNHTSNTTFGGSVEVSGLDPIIDAISGLGAVYFNVSGLTPILTQVSSIGARIETSGFNLTLAAISGLSVGISGLDNILTAVSSVAVGVANIATDDAAELTSGTLAHTARMLRWFAWEDLYIDKTYLPNRMYLRTDATNYSSYFTLIDNVNYTERVRGG